MKAEGLFVSFTSAIKTLIQKIKVKPALKTFQLWISNWILKIVVKVCVADSDQIYEFGRWKKLCSEAHKLDLKISVKFMGAKSEHKKHLKQEAIKKEEKTAKGIAEQTFGLSLSKHK